VSDSGEGKMRQNLIRIDYKFMLKSAHIRLS
jgi:hypothetical protein